MISASGNDSVAVQHSLARRDCGGNRPMTWPMTKCSFISSLYSLYLSQTRYYWTCYKVYKTNLSIVSDLIYNKKKHDSNTKVFHFACPQYVCVWHGNNTVHWVPSTKRYNVAFLWTKRNIPWSYHTQHRCQSSFADQNMMLTDSKAMSAAYKHTQQTAGQCTYQNLTAKGP